MVSHILEKPLWVWMPGELVGKSKYASRLVRSASYGDSFGGEEAALHLRYIGNHYDLLLLKSHAVKSRL